ncbi:DUF6602 domain-containing protein [Sorangium sp. So ce295]|uniref:DUF6602 domain-containing protein n=1 Tax=Sorangium sp. So ce295 TaxID=3133295 RepID=UPI003F62A74F
MRFRDPPDVTSLEHLADRYAAELSAQFRTLSLFVSHAGEVGRTHEVFLGQVLSRFLPAKLRIGTGFVLSPESVTRQQDIIVYDWQRLPLLLTIGDCVVVDADAVAATIEVKTVIQGKSHLSDIVRQLSSQEAGGSRRAVGVYAWEGPSLESATECFWSVLRDRPEIGLSPLPDFVYVRGKYLLMPNHDGRIETPPLRVMRLGDGNASEGTGLLGLLAHLWLCGIQSYAVRPWWLEAWERQRSSLFELIPWPSDLQALADAKLTALRGSG